MSTTQRRSLKRAAAGVSAGMLTLTGFAAVATPATAQSNFSLQRQAGADRYATAAQIATNAFATADTVLIASGEAGHFADALTGNFLAGRTGSPVLLTAGDALPKATSDALATLKATKVTILGGTSAVSQKVQDALAANYTVTRIGGANRYATGAQVAAAGGTVGQTEGKGATAFLASGLNFADALVAGGPAYAGRLPVEVTDANTLSPETSASLTSLAIKNVVIVGGTSAVSQKVQDAVVAKGITVTRLAGTTRQGTAAAVANYATGTASGLGFSKSLVDLATGADFADALAGGPSAGKDKAALLLVVNANTLGADTQAYLSANSGTLTGGKVFGGTSAVSDAAVAAAQTAGRGTTQASLTSRPELRSAAVTGTVTPAQFNGTNVQGTTVAYTFDESVAVAPNANRFKLYRSDAGAAGAVTGNTVVSVSGNTVTVRFNTINGTTDSNGNAGGTTGSAVNNVNNYTLATVDGDVLAVTDFQGQSNPAGAAPIGTSGTAPAAQGVANTTVAPDLRSVSGFRVAGTTETAVDFTFDQAAFVINSARFHLVQTDNTDVTCNGGPAVGSTTPASGGIIAGGNGTTTITAICANGGGTGTTTPMTATNVARGYVERNTVADTAANAGTPTNGNPLQSANVSGSGTVDADLVSVQFIPNGTGSNASGLDQVLYTFDQAVTASTGANTLFHVFKSDASQLNSIAIVQRNTALTQILVSFAANALNGAVGASADNSAVTTNNRPASVGVNPVTTAPTTITSGVVAAPQLASVAIASTTDVFGAKTYSAAYNFTKAVGTVITDSTGFKLYLADGTALTGATCQAPSGSNTTNTVVNCTGYTGTATANADTATATLGTVDAGSVTGTATGFTGTNPEGAAATTGSTGTPAA